MGNVRKRLEALERAASGPADFSDWPLEEQMDDAAHMLLFYWRFHGDGGVRYPATDRELGLLGMVFGVDAPRPIRLEDLPEEVGKVFKRMDPKEQPRRDAWLYQDRHRAKQAREREAWHEEHGWDEPTPRHLRWWDGP